MYREDIIIGSLFASFFLFIILATVLLANLADETLWNEAPNDCYIQEVRTNTWGADEVTITEFCPVTP